MTNTTESDTAGVIRLSEYLPAEEGTVVLAGGTRALLLNSLIGEAAPESAILAMCGAIRQVSFNQLTPELSSEKGLAKISAVLRTMTYVRVIN